MQSAFLPELTSGAGLHPAGRFSNRPLVAQEQASKGADEIGAQLQKLLHKRQEVWVLKPAVYPSVKSRTSGQAGSGGSQKRM
jgi:hypothetical protein